jgi:hypothetical protein
MTTYHFRPAVRENTPLIVGIAGPTKSGKTFSAHRLAVGLAGSGAVIMLNAEGARGHQYADKFKYIACELVPPYRYGMFEAVLREAAAQKPGAIIIDSLSHAHDGPGGFLEWHEEELDRLAGKDFQRRDKMNFAAWVKPKAGENAFRYALLEMPCPVILCMRAKDKMKIIAGKTPVDLGLQPIVGEPIAFETIFTLMLPSRSKGVPDLDISEMREPFDAMVPKGVPIDEQLGKRLAEWAKGVKHESRPAPASQPPREGRADAVEDGDQDQEDRPEEAGTVPGGAATPATTTKTRGGLIAEVFDLMNRANGNNQKRSAATLRALSIDFSLPNETSNLSDFPDLALAKIALMTRDQIKNFQRDTGLL